MEIWGHLRLHREFQVSPSYRVRLSQRNNSIKDLTESKVLHAFVATVTSGQCIKFLQSEWTSIFSIKIFTIS
jgi:hypothetical protein